MFKINKYLISVFIFFFSYTLAAQDVNFDITAPSKVEQGSQFSVVYTSNKSGAFTPPSSFDGFRLLRGPDVGTSSYVQISNGRTNAIISYTYTYYLQAQNIGTFKLPIASIVIDGKEYKTSPFNITVVKSTNNQNNQNTTETNINEPEFKPDGIVFVKTNTSSNNVFVGEPIYITEKLYSKNPILNITNLKAPSYTDFWKESLDIGDLKVTKETINGQQYNVVVINKSILFPQKEGTLELGSFNLEGVIRVVKKRKAQDYFEQQMYGNIISYYDEQKVNLKSPIVKINVKKLPANKLDNFNNIVGNFKLETTIDKTTVKANDALVLTVKIIGEGNIELLENPKIVFPSDFEVYDPKISKNINASTTGVTGSKTYEYTIIPRTEGDYKIPSFEFHFFNPKTERYECCTSAEYNIHVEKSDVQTFSSNTNKFDVKYINKDIKYIAPYCSETTKIGSHMFFSLMHLFIILILIILTILAIIFTKKINERRGNVLLMRNKKATKVALKKLKTALKYLKLNNDNLFYEEVHKAIFGYLSDKFNISLSDLSIDNVKNTLVNINLDNSYIEKVIQVLEICNYSRYSPNKSKSDMDNLYNMAIEAISKIEKSLK